MHHKNLKYWKRHAVTTLAAFASITAHSPAHAGEIAGLRPTLPTYLQRDLEVAFVNDFLGRGGSVDDYRTQQLVFSATFSDRWIAVLDHSILTLNEEPSPGRIDQLSVSLGYEWINKQNDAGADRLIVGTGLRNAGRYSGERIQNGFHRIIGSSIEELDYTGESANDMTVWFDAERYRVLRAPTNSGPFKSWRVGYQVRAATLITSDSQWDSALAIQAVISKPATDIWLGLRSDWRDGYESAVLRETAAAEDDLAFVLGARFGPLVIETVQQFNNKSSYGQIRLVSSASDAVVWGRPGFGLGLGALLPDVQLRLTGRLPTRILTADTSKWQESIAVGLGYGKPQYEDDTTLFIRTLQVDVGIEFERPLSDNTSWISAYAGAGAGWRDEKLTRTSDFPDESSAAIGRAVLTASTGLRFKVFSHQDRWRFRLQFGLIGRLPVDDADVPIGEQSFQIHRSALDLMFGATVHFE